nr:hypothetical protein [Tanacetum cinerariifolium]
EAVNKEMDDSLERAATTATSLDAEQDRGDTIAQTRFENVSKFSNDPLLVEVNTPQSEDASKQGRIADIDANEDITLVSTHDEQMFDVDQDVGSEEVFVAQQDENVVKKEVDVAQIQVTTTVTTSTILIDEVTLAQAKVIENVSIEHHKLDHTPLLDLSSLPHNIENTNNLPPNVVSYLRYDKNTYPNYQFAERLQAKEQQELNDKEKVKLFMQLLEKRRKFFAAKSAKKRGTKHQHKLKKKIMCTYLKIMEGKKLTDLKNKFFDSIQKMFDRAFKRLEQERVKKQKIDDDKDTAELQQLVKIIPDEKGVEIDAIPLAIKPPSIINWKIQKDGNKIYYKIIRADESSNIYLIFSHMLKEFNREDVETL